MDLLDRPHRRFNPLTNEWVLVSPHRTTRPWQGKVESSAASRRPEFDPTCYLCPGNERANGQRNPQYDDWFVFENDFAALLPDSTPGELNNGNTLRAERVRGTSRVICFSPRHDLTLGQMDLPAMRKVIDLWAAQTDELGREYQWVQIFENKGEIMGASNSHPHGQIWASDSLPNEPAKEDRSQLQYAEQFGRPMLLDYLDDEISARQRIVIENEHWAALVPFWAIWPFETILIPKRHVIRLPELGPHERDSLAEILKKLLTRYDNLFEISFPHTMGWHGAPFNDSSHDHWQLHAHFYPPLLRSATVKKFMVGYEMLAEAQRDITPELAASRLRELSETRFDEQL